LLKSATGAGSSLSENSLSNLLPVVFAIGLIWGLGGRAIGDGYPVLNWILLGKTGTLGGKREFPCFSSPKNNCLLEFIGIYCFELYYWSLGTEKKIGFLKLKGESVMKLFRLSLGTQKPPSRSSFPEEEELLASSTSTSLRALHLRSTFSALEEFWLSPVEWLVVLAPLSTCFTSSTTLKPIRLILVDAGYCSPTNSLISWWLTELKKDSSMVASSSWVFLRLWELFLWDFLFSASWPAPFLEAILWCGGRGNPGGNFAFDSLLPTIDL